MSIYVGNLSYDVTREDLEFVFSDYGKPTRISLPIDHEAGRPRGFAFVDMASQANEKVAIETLNGAEWMGRQMKVNEAKPRGASEENGKYRRNAL